MAKVTYAELCSDSRLLLRAILILLTDSWEVTITQDMLDNMNLRRKPLSIIKDNIKSSITIKVIPEQSESKNK